MFSSLYNLNVHQRGPRTSSFRSLIPLPSSGLQMCPSWMSGGGTRSRDAGTTVEQERLPAQSTDVIVIGAGLSGLVAAKFLQDKDVSVLVLEAKDRVGGRTLSIKNQKLDVYIDMGGSHIGPSHTYIRRLAIELDVERYEVQDNLSWIYYHNGSKYLFEKHGMPQFRNPIVNIDLRHTFYVLDEMAKEVPLDCPWLAPHARDWDQMTMQCFAKKYIWTQTARDFFEKAFVNTIALSEANEVSMLWFLWFIKQGIKSDIFYTMTQNQKFTEGAQRISDRISDMLGGKVLLEKPACQIKQTLDSVVVTTVNGEQYRAKYVISAIPLPLMLKIHFSPNLPILLNELAQRVSMTTVIKCVVFYRVRFWRLRGLSGYVVFSDTSLDNPFSYITDDSKPDGSNAALAGYITGKKARILMTYPRCMRLRSICKSLAKLFDCEAALQPLHYEEMIWCGDQYTGGWCSAVCPPGCLTSFGSALRESFGRVYFAGAETSLRWSGFMDGAVCAGERAAKEVLTTMGRLPMNEAWKDALEDKIPLPQMRQTDSTIFRYLTLRYYTTPEFYMSRNMLRLSGLLAILSVAIIVYSRLKQIFKY